MESGGEGMSVDLDELEQMYSQVDDDDGGKIGPNSEVLSEPKEVAAGASSSSIVGGKVVVEEILNSDGKRVSKNSVLVNPRQRGNPVLKFIRNVPWEFAPILPDYVMGVSTCGLFLSIRYHNLHPDYIHERLKVLGKNYKLRVLLIHVDVTDPYPILKTLTHIGILADLTLIPAHTPEEIGRIIENYKIYENKPADIIQEVQESSILQQVIDALTSIRSVNKTDALTLLNNFGSLSTILKASPEQIASCPGFGPQKAKRLYESLHQDFKKQSLSSKSPDKNFPDI